ncbi:MAG TPA: hypothetical protein ACFYD1_09760, partial [Candidatus Hypogeohydataceae bacterium YC38]
LIAAINSSYASIVMPPEHLSITQESVSRWSLTYIIYIFLILTSKIFAERGDKGIISLDKRCWDIKVIVFEGSAH